MIVVNSHEVESVEMKDQIVKNGPVTRKPLVDSKDTGGYGAHLVTFEPGTGLNFHTHDADQILWITGGKGIIATRGKEVEVSEGCIVVIPAGEGHLHKAGQGTPLIHLAIQKSGIKLAE